LPEKGDGVQTAGKIRKPFLRRMKRNGIEDQVGKLLKSSID
jgi:hypothetical protein